MSTFLECLQRKRKRKRKRRLGDGENEDENGDAEKSSQLATNREKYVQPDCSEGDDMREGTPMDSPPGAWPPPPPAAVRKRKDSEQYQSSEEGELSDMPKRQTKRQKPRSASFDSPYEDRSAYSGSDSCDDTSYYGRSASRKR